MKITHLNVPEEITISVAHGLRRTYNENRDTTIDMIVVGVGESSLDGFIRKILAYPKFLPDNIVGLALDSPASLNKVLKTKCNKHLHIYLPSDVLMVKEEIASRMFVELWRTLHNHVEIEHVYLHGPVLLCMDVFAQKYKSFWLNSNKFSVGIDSLASNVGFTLDGVTNFEMVRSQIEEQRPAKGRGKDWFIGDNFVFADSRTIMKIVAHIHNHPEQNRTVISPLLADKLFKDLVCSE